MTNLGFYSLQKPARLCWILSCPVCRASELLRNLASPLKKKKKNQTLRRATTSHCQKTAAWPLIYLFHNESCDAFLIGVGVGLCVDNEDVGVRPVCDPELVSVQDVVVA